MIGSTVSHYKILDKLGGGGMGVVYRAEDLTLGRQVALKFLPDELAADPEALARFEREARAASALEHPHICVIHELGEEAGRPFIVMELLEGETLAAGLTGEPLEVERIVRVGRQVANALEAAHRAGVVHRDIKPENLFVNRRGDVKILDFGLAKLTPDAARRDPQRSAAETELAEPALTSPGTAMGTIAYMSPEQVLGKELDRRTDLFSLGAVLYEMATGRRPFAGTTSGAIFDQILNRAPTAAVRLNPELPEGLEHIVAKALEKDRSLRYQSAREIEADLERLQRDATVARLSAAAGPPGSAPARGAVPPATASRRGRWIGLRAAALVLVLALALAAGIWLDWGADRADEPAAPAAAGPAATSIAVLPFADMSPGGDQGWLANGMAEELIESLSRIPQLRVIARTSAFALRGQEIQEVGARLGVGSVVDGSVRRSGDELRITAQLVRAPDGFRVWSARYDRRLDDVFAIQSEIARHIAEAIRSELGIEDGSLYGSLPLGRYVPRDVRAYELLRKGIEVGTFALTQEALGEGSERYREALRIDPGYADAHAMLGLHDCLLWLIGYDPSEERRASAEASAGRALAVDESNATAHQVLAILDIQKGEFAAAERRLELALETHPQNGGLRMRYAELLAETGRLEAAVAQAQNAAMLDPLAPVRHVELGNIYLLAGDYDAAIGSLEHSLELNPQQLGGGAHLSSALHLAGRDEEALEAVVRNLPESARALEDPLRQGFSVGGYAGMVRALNEQMVAFAGAPCGFDPGLTSHFYAITGEADPMYRCLDQALASGRTTGLYLKVHPVWGPYRGEPRFQALLRRRGLAV